MKKILFLCHGDNYPEGAFQLIRALRAHEPLLVKGMFFTPVDLEQMIPISYIPIAGPYIKLKEGEKMKVKQMKERFKKECEESDIVYRIHDNKGEWNKELFVKESRFADLVVMSEERFSSDIPVEQPNFYMAEALRVAECAVVAVPEAFLAVERICVAYDGNAESIFALKQFGYLFPEFSDLPIEFIHIKDEISGNIPDVGLLQEYVSLHFNEPHTSKLHFDPKKYFTSWLENEENVLVVTGSFSRSAFSNLMKPSFAEKLICNHSCPVFIAHFP